jgi:DNA invertase Pin-like site-specific DNA recombinase
MKVTIYARISKDASDLDNQLIVLTEYCERMNYEIVEKYTDII